MKKILLFILFTLSFNIFSENLENLKKIDGITQKYIDNETIPGSVVLISKNGKIVYLKASGYAQLYDKDKKLEKPVLMNENTIFDLASLTKVMGTAQAIMKLCSENKINVDDKVSKYIKGFEKNGKENVRIKDLLTHTSGRILFQGSDPPPLPPQRNHLRHGVRLLGALHFAVQPRRSGARQGFPVGAHAGRRLE